MQAHENRIQQVLDQFPHYIATSSQGFRAAKSMSNGYFIKTNLQAKSIHRFCQRAVSGNAAAARSMGSQNQARSGGFKLKRATHIWERSEHCKDVWLFTQTHDHQPQEPRWIP